MSAHPEVSAPLAPANLARSTRPAGARGKPDPFNTTAFRLSVGYTLLVTLAVAVTLGSAYLLTQSLITEDVDLIIDTEMKGLNDKFNRSGLSGLTDEINLRIDSWGRVGAVYLLVDKKYDQIAGNVEQWPFKGMPAERRPEFTIETIEPTVVQILSRNLFLQMIQELEGNPESLRALLDISFERQRHYMNEFLSRIRDTPEQRYTNLIKERPHIVRRVPQHYIASYLGITSVHLSRIKNKLAQKNRSKGI